MFNRDDFDPADLDAAPRPFMGDPNDPEHPGEPDPCECGQCPACVSLNREWAEYQAKLAAETSHAV